MTRPERDRLLDIDAACTAIAEHLQRDADDDLVFDAIRIRLVEIGEAVKALPASVRDREPLIPWGEIARMRDVLAHRYFDMTHAIVFSTARSDIPLLAAAVARLLAGSRSSLG